MSRMGRGALIEKITWYRESTGGACDSGAACRLRCADGGDEP